MNNKTDTIPEEFKQLAEDFSKKVLTIYRNPKLAVQFGRNGKKFIENKIPT